MHTRCLNSGRASTCKYSRLARLLVAMGATSSRGSLSSQRGAADNTLVYIASRSYLRCCGMIYGDDGKRVVDAQEAWCWITPCWSSFNPSNIVNPIAEESSQYLCRTEHRTHRLKGCPLAKESSVCCLKDGGGW
jgi:hypothetical protein